MGYKKTEREGKGKESKTEKQMERFKTPEKLITLQKLKVSDSPANSENLRILTCAK